VHEANRALHVRLFREPWLGLNKGEVYIAQLSPHISYVAARPYCHGGLVAHNIAHNIVFNGGFPIRSQYYGQYCERSLPCPAGTPTVARARSCLHTRSLPCHFFSLPLTLFLLVGLNLRLPVCAIPPSTGDAP
jgi:hypothetical protein